MFLHRLVHQGSDRRVDRQRDELLPSPRGVPRLAEVQHPDADGQADDYPPMVCMGLTCLTSTLFSMRLATPSNFCQKAPRMDLSISPSVAPPRRRRFRSYSATLKRQGTMFPFALRRILSQSPQKGLVIDV